MLFVKRQEFPKSIVLITVDEVGYQLGHEPGSPMTRRYAQFIPDAQKRIAERSESVLNGLLSNAK